jgi:hypothetical protein
MSAVGHKRSLARQIDRTLAHSGVRHARGVWLALRGWHTRSHWLALKRGWCVRAAMASHRERSKRPKRAIEIESAVAIERANPLTRVLSTTSERANPLTRVLSTTSEPTKAPPGLSYPGVPSSL